MNLDLVKITKIPSELEILDQKSRILYASRSPSSIGGISKRLVDIALSSAALLLLAPIFVATAIAIKACDGGTILFVHKRVGRDGKPFGCLKFRTMCMDAERRLENHLQEDAEAAEEWKSTRKLKRDPRLTKIGLGLRRSSIDELPQFINVLRGDMSLVGPRPIVSAEAAFYGPFIHHYLSTRPGLTGAWQVSGRSDISYSERVRLDAEYCSDWSLLKDVSIIFRTVPALFSRRGSY